MTPSTIHPPDGNLQTIEQAIMENIGRPDALEQLYRSDRSSFKKAFERTYVHLKEHIVAQVWQERLKTPQEETTWGQRNEWIFLAVTIFASGCILKIPSLTGINEEFFYPRNIPLAIIPMLAAYFLRNQHTIQRIALPAITFLIASVYINLLPDNNKSDTLTLACIHMPIFLWTVAGSVFPSNGSNHIAKRMEFLAFNGDLLIMTTILAIAGVLFSGITFGLFHLINISIDGFYADYLVIWGAPAIPIIATSLIRNNPSLVNRISPVIARIFTPLVFVMLLVFLGAIAYTGKDPYNDREFLLLFNALLAGVMAIILFSVSGSGKTEQGPRSWLILFGLALLAIIANSIALSAIVFRIFEWGVTPNRVAVLGSNVFIFIHLIAVTVQLYKTVIKGAAIERANQAIAVFIPVYGAWAAFVVFVLPLLFQFK